MKRYTCAALTPDINEREERNRIISRKAAEEGIVLLENDGALPLKAKKIALFGAGARHTVKGGTGSGEVNERYVVTICEGFENAGYEITSKQWLDDYDAEVTGKTVSGKKKKLDFVNILSVTPMAFGRLIRDTDVDPETDTAIYVVARQAGEGGDKKLELGDFDLDDTEAANIRFITEKYNHTVLVINSGSYMSLSKIDGVPVGAVVFCCQMGMEGGNALVNVLNGTVTPSGKLTDTWAKAYSDVPCGGFYSYLAENKREQFYKEGIYVGYRYYDTFRVEPRYHFGYGLSYTTFEVGTAEYRPDIENQCIRGTVNVTNTGSVIGRETVQVYVSAPDGELKKEYQRLVAFKKTRPLQPGESETLKFSFTFASLASFSEKEASYILESGKHIIRTGTASDRTSVSAVIVLNEKACTAELKNACRPIRDIAEIQPVVRPVTDDLTGVPEIILNASDIRTEKPVYENPAPYEDEAVSAVMNRLTKDEIISVLIGEGIGGMMSTDKLFVPGAVGRTTSKLYKKGLINVNLCDGPAGLRILRVSALTKKGKQKFIKGNNLLSMMDDMPALFTKFTEGDEEKDTLMYQYVSSFPVGTTLAQTWNTDLLEEVGRAISDEMQEYGITYWLAPAMNIHKNPLCGRNFEYMSEDPVLTGKMASALIRGVQYIDGNYVTIKHFACNNAEDDRNYSNSHVNERALREIYLKGFEIAVKEGRAASVMSSYNKLNEIYTPDNYDLLTTILRNEWGFEGLVMTDWFATMGTADPARAIASGNDLLMPGTPLDKMSIKKGLKNGTLTELDLSRSASRIIREILQSSVAKRVKPEMFE